MKNTTVAKILDHNGKELFNGSFLFFILGK